MGDAAAVAERADLDLAQRRAGLQLHRRVVHKQGSRDPMRGFQPSGAAPPWLMWWQVPKQNGRMETHCLAGHVRLELANPSASYLFGIA